jgi:hypothetical protein
LTAPRIYTEADGVGGEENGTDRAKRRKSISGRVQVEETRGEE